MAEQMTAKDLHDLVAPLWAAVPETVPTWTSGASSRRMTYSPRWAGFWWPFGCHVTVQEAEVRIIHAIEEWVLSTCGWMNTFRYDAGDWSASSGSGDDIMTNGPTRLHALVRLAMCIHEDNPITTGDAGKEKR